MTTPGVISCTCRGGTGRLPNMLAAQLVGFGGPGNLVLTDVPDPEPGPGDVLIAVAAAAVKTKALERKKPKKPRKKKPQKKKTL